MHGGWLSFPHLTLLNLPKQNKHYNKALEDTIHSFCLQIFSDGNLGYINEETSQFLVYLFVQLEFIS